MRSLLVLSALALLGVLAAPSPASAAVCDPDAPLNGYFCAGELCQQLGVTTYDHDRQTPIACAYDSSFNRNVWKPMTSSSSSGGSSGSYTAWGTNTCASGWSVAYTGVAISPMSALQNDAPGVSGNTICYGQPFIATANSRGFGWTNGNTEASNFPVVCAVCVK